MKTFLSLGFGAALLTLSAIASADAIPPDVSACNGKQANDSCSWMTVSGKCVSSKCGKLDYSDGSPPSTITYDCLECSASGSDGGSESDGGTSSGGKGGCAVSAASLGTWAIALIPMGALAFLKRRKNKNK